MVVTCSLGKDPKSSDLHPGTLKANVGLQRGKSNHCLLKVIKVGQCLKPKGFQALPVD